jgi:hypothetical protein
LSSTTYLVPRIFHFVVVVVEPFERMVDFVKYMENASNYFGSSPARLHSVASWVSIPTATINEIHRHRTAKHFFCEDGERSDGVRSFDEEEKDVFYPQEECCVRRPRHRTGRY